MRLDAARSGELLAVLRATTMALPEFTAKYASLWRSYARTRDSMETMNIGIIYHRGDRGCCVADP